MASISSIKKTNDAFLWCRSVYFLSLYWISNRYFLNKDKQKTLDIVVFVYKISPYLYNLDFKQRGSGSLSATIKDVALLASVSTTTVSHVLNKTRFVAKTTQERVLKAAEE
jgi:hypothetical protein